MDKQDFDSARLLEALHAALGAATGCQAGPVASLPSERVDALVACLQRFVLDTRLPRPGFPILAISAEEGSVTAPAWRPLTAAPLCKHQWRPDDSDILYYCIKCGEAHA